MPSRNSLAGSFLIAMPNMGDARFEQTVIYLCAHSADGAMGFVVNRTLDRPGTPEFLAKLGIVDEEESHSLGPHLQRPLHSGGPVEPGRGFVLHTNDYHSKTTLRVDSAISLTATLEILRQIALDRGPRKCLVALGYAGWAGGQLEEEIAANGWLTAPGSEDVIFDTCIEDRYRKAFDILGFDPNLLSADAGHA